MFTKFESASPDTIILPGHSWVRQAIDPAKTLPAIKFLYQRAIETRQFYTALNEESEKIGGIALGVYPKPNDIFISEIYSLLNRKSGLGLSMITLAYEIAQGEGRALRSGALVTFDSRRVWARLARRGIAQYVDTPVHPEFANRTHHGYYRIPLEHQ